MKKIDLNSWDRKEQFLFFYNADYPQFNICMNLDISNFLSFVKTQQLSFYFSMIFATTKVANEIQNFRYRINSEGEVVLYHSVNPSFTYLPPEGTSNLFKMIAVNMEADIFEFNKQAKAISESQTVFIDKELFTTDNNWLYLSCVPWIAFTHISHTITLNRNDSVPRITWGKYYREGDRILLPFSVQVHHALADGYHVGQYVELLQKYLSSFDDVIL